MQNALLDVMPDLAGVSIVARTSRTGCGAGTGSLEAFPGPSTSFLVLLFAHAHQYRTQR